MSPHTATVVGLLACLLAAAPREAVLTGVVVDDVTKLPVAGAVVEAPAAAKRATTDDKGEFELKGLPAGTVRIEVRHLGHAAESFDITIGADEKLTRRIVLKKAVVLDSVVVKANVDAIESFEEHKRIGLGRFLTREDLAKREDNSKLSEILRSVRGAHLITVSGHAWLGSSRGTTSLANQKCGKTLEGVPNAGRELTCACYAQVYVDNAPYYRGGDREEVPDLNRFQVSQIESIEYYSSAAQTPFKYSKLNSECGVLVIHTRRSRSPQAEFF